MERDDGGNYQNKPRRRATSWARILLPGFERLAPVVDGAGKGLATWRATDRLVRPFLEHLAASDLSPKTIQKHVDNMWALGGEFIRDLHNDPSLRKKPVERVLSGMIGYGGPLLYHGGEDEQRSFDSTCRKFRRFLDETPR